MTTEAATQSPPAEATGAAAAEDDASRVVTPAPDATVQPGETGEGGGEVESDETPEPVRELIHSEETLAAARAEAEASGLDRGRRETALQAQTRRQAVANQFQQMGGDAAPVLRRWQQRLTDYEVAPENQQEFLNDGRVAFDQMTDAAMAVAGTAFHSALMGLLGDEANQKAFNDELGGLDDATDVFKTYANFVALDQPSVAKAPPEDLIKRNKSLATHIQSLVDQATIAGRKQGQRDPNGRELNPDIAAAKAVPSWDAFNAMTPEQQDALGAEGRAAVYAADRARRARIA